MARILLKGVESAIGTSSANGSNFGNAKLVRVINTSDYDRIVTLTETVGGSDIASFKIMYWEDVALEKEPLNGIYASDIGVRGVPIGYTN